MNEHILALTPGVLLVILSWSVTLPKETRHALIDAVVDSNYTRVGWIVDTSFRGWESVSVILYVEDPQFSWVVGITEQNEASCPGFKPRVFGGTAEDGVQYTLEEQTGLRIPVDRIKQTGAKYRIDKGSEIGFPSYIFILKIRYVEFLTMNHNDDERRGGFKSFIQVEDVFGRYTVQDTKSGAVYRLTMFNKQHSFPVAVRESHLLKELECVTPSPGSWPGLSPD